MNAYVAEICDSDLQIDEFEAWRTSGRSNSRSHVFRIQPVNFWDRLLCQRAWGLTPEEIVRRLSGHVDSVSVLNDGVLLIVSREILDRDHIISIDGRIRPLLAADR